MNILIVTPFYKQDKTIGSVRWTNLAMRLAKHHNVIVVTQPLDNNSEEITMTQEDNLQLIRCNQLSLYEKIASRYFGGDAGNDWQTKPTAKSLPATNQKIRESFLRKIKNRVFYASAEQKARSYAKWICRNAIPSDLKIDIVISSACPFIEMLFGYELKKQLKCRWVCDFRDLPFMIDANDDTHLAKAILFKVLNHADTITVVTKGLKRYLQSLFPHLESKISVLTNGFSLSDQRNKTVIADNKLHVVYTGSLYAGSRFDLLFRAVKEIQKEHPFQFFLDFVGGRGSVMAETARQYGLEESVRDNGFLPREKALEFQNSADCLLLLASENLSALPAKMFEYILCKKPVVCLTHDPEGKAEVTDVVKDLNLGVAVEEANGAGDFAILKDFLLKQWQRKCNEEPLEYYPDMEKIKRYDHDNLVISLEDLMNRLLTSKIE